MTDYEQYLLDKLKQVKDEKHGLERDLFNMQQAVLKESREAAELRRLNHELSLHINYLQDKSID